MTKPFKRTLLRFKKPRTYQFPRNFLWGSATSSYQVEGGIDRADWTHWEPGHIKNDDRAGRACGHFELYEKDFDLAQQLGHNAHRFSIEWSRIEPEEGKWDDSALEHYRKVLEALHARGITPMVTLHHFTSPQWLERFGFWSSLQTVDFFSRYVKKVTEVLLPYCSLWVTINEPMLVIYFGYMVGTWPPGETGIRPGIAALKNIVEAHANAYQILHQEAKKRGLTVSVGLAHHMRINDPDHFSNPLDIWVCFLRNYFLNSLLPETLHSGFVRPPLGFFKTVPRIRRTQDFIGLNYYARGHVKFDMKKPSNLFGVDVDHEDVPQSSLGWEIYPRGLYRILKYLKHFDLPVYISENGIATLDDRVRQKFIHSHLKEVAHALKDGVDVRGFFYWSLMDNFEWLEGFEPRFGLVEIDYKTLERKVRPSARYYQKICQEGILEL